MQHYRHKVPIHLDQQDHFIAGLTARQILIIGCGASIGYMIFNDLINLTPALWATIIGIILGSLCVLIALVAAFLHPKGRGLEQWSVVYLLYLANPKVFLWRSGKDDESIAEETVPKKAHTPQAHERKEDEEW